VCAKQEEFTRQSCWAGYAPIP